MGEGDRARHSEMLTRARVTAKPSRETDQMNWLGKPLDKRAKAAFDLPEPLGRVRGAG
jgi:hypothetical protein